MVKTLTLLAMLGIGPTHVLATEKPLVSKLQQYVERSLDADEKLTTERQVELIELSKALARQIKTSKKASLLFVCTHNSRRSQMCQLWTLAASYYYNIDGIDAHSGGTEATAFNPRAVAAMRRAGFLIKTKVPGQNPRYDVTLRLNTKPVEAFSKVYNDLTNPRRDFIAVMVCGDADEKCPVVVGSAERVPLHFVDPKISDGTAKETETYDARCQQIANEMLFVMRNTKRLLTE